MLNEVVSNLTGVVEDMNQYGAYPGAGNKEKQKAAIAKVIWLGAAVAGTIVAVYGGYELVKTSYSVAHPILSKIKPM